MHYNPFKLSAVVLSFAVAFPLNEYLLRCVHFFSNVMNFVLESHADGEGKYVRRRNKMCGDFHAPLDSEIYASE